MRIRSKKRFSSFLTIIVCLFVGIIYVSFGHSKPKEPLKVKEEIKLDLFSQQAHGAEISEMKKVPEKLLVEQEIKKESIKKNYHYVNSHRVRVYGNLKDKKVIDTLSKGTRISILKREKIEKYTWIKVKYINDLKDKEGWIRSDMVSDSLKVTLPKSWSGLDFNYNKGLKEYANNPRVVVKGIYLNIYTMCSERKLNKLIKLANTSEINAFVIDV
ncbi:MAG: SH3 domain-containing protein, partial [Cetobacterium sp.]|nr:SH3 domain-containing protein [Cetobacterium sp.]